jgi:hypothetical protein
MSLRAAPFVIAGLVAGFLAAHLVPVDAQSPGPALSERRAAMRAAGRMRAIEPVFAIVRVADDTVVCYRRARTPVEAVQEHVFRWVSVPDGYAPKPGDVEGTGRHAGRWRLADNMASVPWGVAVEFRAARIPSGPGWRDRRGREVAPDVPGGMKRVHRGGRFLDVPE